MLLFLASLVLIKISTAWSMSGQARTSADTAKEQASTCDEPGQAVSEINVMMGEVTRTTEEPSLAARQISETTAQSKDAVESIDRATKEQASESAGVVGVMARVREAAKSCDLVVSPLEGMVVSLRDRASSLDRELKKVKVGSAAAKGSGEEMPPSHAAV